MTNQMHAAESLDDTACSGQRALTHPSGGAMRAARNQIARPAAARSGGAVPAGIVPGPAASHPLAGEGSSAAGMDVFSLQTHPAVSDGRRGLFEGAKAKRWTAEEMRVLLDRRLQAHPIPEIAASLGRTPQSVEYKWGLLARRLPASVVARVREQVRHNVGRKPRG